MKMKALTIAVAALAIGHTASAQTIVNITGATAFRAATLDTIKARLNASGVAWKLAHDKATGPGVFNSSTRAIFQGTIGTDPVIIRTSFNGSVEGIKALVDSPASDPTYYPTSALTSITAAVNGNNSGEGVNTTATPEAAQSDFAFSDVNKSSTPFKNNALQPASAEVGVVTFTMVGNESFPTNAVNSLNTQNFRALLAGGFQRLNLITGNPADTNVRVYVVGRNDGSGTRTTYLAETDFGVTTLVKQYIVGSTSGDTITGMYLVPAGGWTTGLSNAGQAGTFSNASTVWGQDVSGNGGYASGGGITNLMQRTSTAVTNFNAAGTPSAATVNAAYVSWLSTGDAKNIIAGGGKILGYNGVRLNDYASSGTFSAADSNKVTQGAYTAWGYQQLYRRNDITSGVKVSVYDAIKNNLSLGSSGISTTAMAASRPDDGGVVAP